MLFYNNRSVVAPISEYKALGRLGFPVLVTQLGIIVVSFADTLMVGHYGLEELAASAFVNSFFMVCVVMLIGFANGLTPLAGALYGRGENMELGRLLKAGLQLNIILGICFTFIMGVLYFFLSHFGQPHELLPLIRPYYLIILLSLIPMSVFNTFQQVSNGCTDTSTPMWIILGSNILNIIGNYMLIFGKWGAPELGLTGAGLSTLTARTLAAITIYAIYACSPKRRIYRGTFKTAHNLGNVRKEIWRTSYPVMIQSGVEVCLWTLGAVVSGWWGKIQLAAYQVINTISQLGFMIFMSVGVAVSIRVANFSGQNDWGRVRATAKAGVHLNFLLALGASLLFFFFGNEMVRLFVEDPATIVCAVALIPPLILYQFSDAMQLTYANALRGTSHVRPLLIVTIVSYIIIGMPLLLLLAQWFRMGNIGVYYSFSGALMSACLLLWWFFQRTVRNLSANRTDNWG